MVSDESKHRVRFPKWFGYRLLRWVVLLGGLVVCSVVSARDWRTLEGGEVWLLGALGALVRLRPVTLRRAGGSGQLTYIPGEGLCVVALLRGGPEEALTVALLAGLLALPFGWRGHLKHPLEAAEDLCRAPAVFWAGGHVYALLGGQRVRTFEDCGWFFQQPLAIVVPLVLTLFLTHDVFYRGYTALLMVLTQQATVRSYLRDWTQSMFVYIECLCASLGLVLWTVWGWSTLPAALLITGIALLATRSTREHVAARQEAESDPLTGLASGRGLENFLSRLEARASRTGGRFAVLFLDADGLKRVNDGLGHAAGDALLRLIGDCCRASLRQGDLAGRRGGDEFLLVLDGLDRADAEAMRSRLQASVEAAVAARPEFAGVAGVSVGVALYPSDSRDRSALIELADRQMYADKQARKTALAV